MDSPREGGLLAWQWSLYANGHRDRRNLLVHVLTVPIFMLGTCALVAAPFVGWWNVPIGAAAMVGAMGLQGWTHRAEAVAPVPFRGALDVVARIMAEQWITFPRFVLTGGLFRSWWGRGR